MSGNGISVAELQRWSAESVRAVFHAATDRGRAAFDVADGLAALDVFDDWGGDTAVAAKTSISQTRQDLDAHGQEAMAVAHAAKTAADGIEALQARLRALIAEADQHALVVNPSTSRVEFSDHVTNPVDALITALDLQHRLDALLADADALDDTLATAINMADGDAVIPSIPGAPEHAETRLQHQIDAFTEVFGRPPVSAADWETAAALDPHSYEDKNAGAEPHIVVGRIQPVPGQGVVRANLFIPSASVKDPTLSHWPPFDDNAGDNRGFDPAAGPERARVSVDVDYENGLVVVRQNPSVNLTTGQVRAGTPTVKVAQRRDGSVYLRYQAADPFSPGGETLAKNTLCVQGELVVQPGAATPRLGGVVSAFPALEVYNDRAAPGGVPTTATLGQMWPANTGQWGPMLGLPFTRSVGDDRLLSDFVGVATGTMYPLPTPLGPPAHPPAVVMVK
ncbi:hypothetical protein [Mycobacterium talmoniae]|uniref:DUF4226 domain-containing protein n=1 Tax=Mycobacterium talmoniae TaxID=1858794 RepID=A0A1S1NHN2_9MYCO|nr:hypothetical protein [Mycobacterium talmoniae]OHV05314.1 hypothetical protein BKN37_06080 [Mycobacterium talmoniae]